MFEKINCPPAVSRTLSAQITGGTAAGSYIFAGPDREIKYQTALEFVRLLNCGSSRSSGCLCPSCLKPLPQTLFCSKKPGCEANPPPCHLCLSRDGKSNQDFLLVTSDKSLGIDPARYLIHFMTRKSAPGVFKAAVIRESELLSPDAENSLLKILEEPPPNCLIILISPALHSLLPTIRSRSQLLRFPPLESHAPITESDMETWRRLARFRDGGSWKELFAELKGFHDVNASKNKTAAAARREKTHAFIESLLYEASALMREKPSDRLSYEIEYMHECCQMLKKQRMPNVVISRMLFKGIPSFLEGK